MQTNTFLASVGRLRDLSERNLGRPRTDQENRDAEWERGRLAAQLGGRLSGYESPSFLAGHARGSLQAREGGVA